MSSSNNEISPRQTNNRRPLVSHLILPTNSEISSKSAPPVVTVSKFFNPNPENQLVPDLLDIFNIPEDNATNFSCRNSPSSDNLIDVSNPNDLSFFDIFDPLKQTASVTSNIAQVSTSALLPSSSYPYPIKLRLKLTSCIEMKPFNQLVEQIRNECQTKQTSIDDICYCKHIQRLTSQHIEQTQQSVTLHIFNSDAKEPLRLTNINLQSTVDDILRQLLEMISFDVDQSILKLRSYEEYLHNDDVLSNIEYVYNCLHSLKPIQFVLVQKPVSITKQQNQISFEQFCLNQQEKYFQTMKQTKPLKSLNKTKQSISSYPTRSFDSQWLEEFRQKINRTLEQIEQCINRLIDPNSMIVSIEEQIKSIQELINYMKGIQLTCSDIQSSKILEKHKELRNYNIELMKHSSSGKKEHLSRLLFDLLSTLKEYIQTYCQAFLLPYEVEIYNNGNQTIDIEQYTSPLITSIPSTTCSITELSDVFTVHIDSLFSLPSNVKTVRVIARLCYGNTTRVKQMTRLMSFVRNTSQENFSQVRFDQRLSFNDAYLCELQRETLILFEIYASFIDENDSSLVSEVFDGISMRLIGWCSQTLFDSEHRLITGERYLGVIDSTIANRTGFYSLRNVSDRDCSILTVSFDNQLVFWPDVQARKDMKVKNITEISQEKQEELYQLLDRSVLLTNESFVENRKQPQLSANVFDEAAYIRNLAREYSDDERYELWSHRHYLIHRPYALPKLLKSRNVWDYPSLIDMYGLVNEIIHQRTIDEIESFELLLPSFPDMYIRSCAYRSLISQISSYDLIFYLPQLLQIIKFDYDYSSPIIEYLLKQCQQNYRLAHKFSWYLRQLVLTENIHCIRYYYIFLALLYVMNDDFRIELQNEYDLCVNLNRIGSEIKTNKFNRGYYLSEQLKELNKDFFQSGQRSCRLPCQFSFKTNNIDSDVCSIFTSLTLPMRIVFNSSSLPLEKYQALYKIGDDLRQDQIVLQLLTCMDKIWQANNFDFHLSLFNVVQTQECCGFIEMITDSETLLDIEKPLGTLKGSFGESALYDWLRKHNATERDLQIAIDNLTYSCAGYCVATYILGIGDRHNENIMVKKSGHLFHIDFGKYLGDTQKFGWFNRDRAPFVFTKQMLYAMSYGGTSNDAMHQFIDLCCDAFTTLRQHSTLLLLLLSHLCSSNVPNLNYDAVRFVYERLVPSKNYADSITYFTDLVVNSLNSTWTRLNGFIHKMAQPLSSTNSIPNGNITSFVPSTYTITHDGKIRSAQIIDFEKRTEPSKHYLYKFKVERSRITYHYRTYNEFYEFYECLVKQYPSISFDLKSSQQTETRMIAQKRLNDIDEFLKHLFGLTNEIIESDIVSTFFQTIQRDQQLNDPKDDRTSNDPLGNNQPKIRLRLKYDNKKLFVMVRHASNLPLPNGNEPRPYCKCYLFPDESKSTKRKGTIMNSRNPIFNETFTYEMDLTEIQKRVLRVSVWNSTLNMTKYVLGEVNIVLSQIDWSKENASNYTLTILNI
ncbi:hypothetical protein I4U23_024258 [Adineta vaga]|nr:hypothetical protein I4U23_024258 [Adineta vaga]